MRLFAGLGRRRRRGWRRSFSASRVHGPGSTCLWPVRRTRFPAQFGDRRGALAQDATQLLEGVFKEQIGQEVIAPDHPACRAQDIPEPGQTENLLACPDVG